MKVAQPVVRETSTTPTSGTSYSYNGDGLRMSAVTSSSTTDFTWDNVSGGGTPLDLNDATTTSSGTTNTSYLYGDLLFGGTAPVEQITTTTSGATVSYLVSNQTGVQGVYNGSGSSLGAVQEMAVCSVYGNQNFTSGTKVTPFAFQGSYADPTGLLYLINRYYDPATDEFLSIDPDVAQTDQPYVFTNDDPLNAEDPLGLCNKKGEIGYYPGACAKTGTQSMKAGAYIESHAGGGGWSLGNALKAEADYGAGLGNGLVSSVSVGFANVSEPFKGSLPWAYGVGSGFGFALTAVGGWALADALGAGDAAYSSGTFGTSNPLIGNSFEERRV